MYRKCPNMIRTIRQMNGLTQSELAERVGCRRETIANLETGRYNPSWQMIYRLSQVLNSCPCLLMAPRSIQLCTVPEHFEYTLD